MLLYFAIMVVVVYSHPNFYKRYTISAKLAHCSFLWFTYFVDIGPPWYKCKVAISMLFVIGI